MRKKTNKKEDSAFARNLRALMEAKGFTNKTAAEVAGVGATTIQDWKMGGSPTDYAAVKRLADGLQVSMTFLLTGEHDAPRGDHTPTVAEVFASTGVWFDGYLKVKVEKMIPRDQITELEASPINNKKGLRGE